MSEKSTALIIGASRGLGLGLAREYLRRGWSVVATVRSESGQTALHELQKSYHALEIETVDITKPDEVDALFARCRDRSFELLFVNAGVTNDPQETVDQVSTEEFVRVMVTNSLSPMRVVERLVECVCPKGMIAVMSSELGSIAGNTSGGWEVYRGSKAALNTLMKSLVARRIADTRTFYVVAPGWVRTDMGGPEALLDIETSIPGVVDALEHYRGTSGLVFTNYRKEILPW
ncbi:MULTISPECIES: SDR family NAD(P)-dependent oxidoreductase [Paraburkholderia]|uniref:NAD(P)-dependent dehydrogenase, short-chain alcohol dehydrogenase family n=1 Tax=Paraburkholderia megapolitana TaxID=420953 RepID=A0A1I3QKE7_9BURK|nr:MULTISPECIES: SDR family NAD(P)-dependent oxidoreductase [Paraburkholderia]MCX4163188.1 SDR family NAD(P)-dependent oxidoreductase [Paraburkholderia megapolitana]MDN7158684.1 SDR family NAD(P)-dependent oxidoreductase [Paraburkholderia sp. CHISQ3]MDQ6495731.1 SDR family NAD(P)-dependent oxidoreductase [Paraburkholderia megapolitana]QDQ81273.1 SDR family NAD(P)-dependent oxidoreductase [Paraburkholderia megapolitana]SFJ34019.1 NAD(P)-dependent dehydrogenase, short-chain alcohol dehydrogenase